MQKTGTTLKGAIIGGLLGGYYGGAADHLGLDWGWLNNWKRGAISGGLIGAMIAFQGMRLHRPGDKSFGQAQPIMNNGDMRVAMTWSNGTSSVSPVLQSVAKADFLETTSNTILDTATAEYGTGAAQAFPAVIDVIYGNEYYSGKVELDAQLVPELQLNKGGVSTTPSLKTQAEKDYRRRDAAAEAALRVMRTNTIPVSEATGPVKDFSIPIPK